MVYPVARGNLAPPMRTFVGLDCGGSTSRVLAIDERGDVKFRGQGGSANLLTTPEATIERNLRRASQGCPDADAVCGAFAGLLGAEQRERACRLLGSLFPGAKIRAEADYAAAHAAAPAGTDVTVIAGTGSLVCGFDANGRLVKTGIGGYLLGDEGSGFRFGRAALVYCLRESQDASPALLSAVQKLFGTDDTAAIVAAVHRADSPQALLARLLPAFSADLACGAEYAEAILEGEEGELAATVAHHVEAHRPGGSQLLVALSGGVWRAGDRFEAAFHKALTTRLGDRLLTVKRIMEPPVQGAVRLAKEVLCGNGE